MSDTEFRTRGHEPRPAEAREEELSGPESAGMARPGRAVRQRKRHSSSARLIPSITHTAQTVVNLAFVLAAWLCAFGLPDGAGRRTNREHMTTLWKKFGHGIVADAAGVTLLTLWTTTPRHTRRHRWRPRSKPRQR